MRLAEKPVYAFRPDGSVMDLAAPDPAEIRFGEIASGLSKIARFNGTNSGLAYVVSQHSVMGAEAILQEGGDELTAALFLLHDAHEHLIGDITRTTEKLIAGVLSSMPENPSLAFRYAIEKIKRKWDEAIYFAAGLPLPENWTARQTMTVAAMDNRMLHAEVAALFGEHAARNMASGDRRPPKTRGAITPWPAMKAEERFNEMLSQLPIQSAFAAGA
ncbi:hypothetical protein [Martelella endophytica]|uniref:hypothetical protein n=1 Tax=Martelella endophytica TaxID=1486262 RepID=UPI0005F25BEF|nr:hypothetical protein [Martelella endophytica]